MSPSRRRPGAAGFERRLLTFNVVQIGALAVVVGGATVALWTLLVPALEAHLKNGVRATVDRLQTRLEIAAASEDQALTAEVMHPLLSRDDFDGAVVILEDGRVLYEFPPQSTSRLAALLRAPERSPVVGEGFVGAWGPIVIEGTPLGKVAFSSSTERLDLLHRWLWGFGGLMLLGLLAGLANALYFDKRFVAPFRRITEFAQQIGDGRLQVRLDRDEGVAEVNDLVRALNRMADELETQRSALESARAAAEHASTAKTRFLANMSHEIRTPLNGVIGIAELMLADAAENDAQQDLHTIRSSAIGLLAILDDVLDIAKIEAERLEVERIDTDLQEVLEHALDAVLPRAWSKGLRLVAELDPGVPRHILGDPTRLRQILMNLLTNALKFTEEGAVTVHVRASQGTLQIEVEDEGVGMSPEALERIFDAFLQADASTTRRFGGTGLGLTISKRLAVLLGGDLTARSVHGVGSAFLLTLPLEVVPPPSEPSDQRVAVLGPGVDPVWVASVTARLQPACEVVEVMDANLVVVLDEGAEAPPPLPALPAGVPIVLLAPTDRRDIVAAHAQALHARVAREPAFASGLLSASSRPVLNRTRALVPLRVLVVEDERVNQTVARRMLVRLGHHADLAEDGQDALHILLDRRAEFDLVLMDLHMPNLDGYETTRALRAAGLDVPILALTADAMRGADQRCFDAGMNGYLSKPIRLDELDRALRVHSRPAVA